MTRQPSTTEDQKHKRVLREGKATTVATAAAAEMVAAVSSSDIVVSNRMSSSDIFGLIRMIRLH